MPNKRKRTSNPLRKAKFLAHPQKLIKKKADLKKKRQANKEKWANDKEYAKQQYDKGYEKIDGKWVRVRIVKVDDCESQ